MSDTVSIDPDFESLLPKLSPDAYTALQVDILRDGCRDPIVVWEEKSIVLDGHHRFSICDANELDYEYSMVSLPDKEAAKLWILHHARARRNLTPNQLSYFRGVEYNLEKTAGHGDQSARKSCGQNTAERLSDDHKVSPRTIENDGNYASAVDAIAENVGADAKQDILSGETHVPRDEVKAIAELPKAKQKTAVAVLLGGSGKQNLKADQNKGVIEWYTPAEWIERARTAMGSIDLDPASCKQANEIVKADEFYDEKDNGLGLVWAGNVYLNPPFMASLIAPFIEKLCVSYTSKDISQAVLLTNNNTDTRWWHQAAETCQAICFSKGRVPFYNPAKEIAAPTNGHTIFYFGKRTKSFVNAFSDAGIIMECIK